MNDEFLSLLADLNMGRLDELDVRVWPRNVMIPLENRVLHRADGRDYVRRIRMQIDSFGRTREEAQEAFDTVAAALLGLRATQENVYEDFDADSLVYRKGARYSYDLVIREE